MRQVAVQTPLFSVAVAVTAGILTDRFATPPIVFLLAAAVAGFVGWACPARREGRQIGVVCLLVAAAALGGLWHHFRHLSAPDDIRHLATDDGRIVRLQGVALENTLPGRSS